MNLAPRQTLSMFFRSCSSTPWPSDKPIGLVHVPKRRPCTNRFGFRSRWTDDARERQNSGYYITERCVVSANWAGLQLDPCAYLTAWSAHAPVKLEEPHNFRRVRKLQPPHEDREVSGARATLATPGDVEVMGKVGSVPLWPRISRRRAGRRRTGPTFARVCESGFRF